MRSVGCVGSARTFSTPLTKTENFDISNVSFIHQVDYFYHKLNLGPMSFVHVYTQQYN